MSKKEATLKDLLDAINGFRNDFKSSYSTSARFNNAQNSNSENNERQSRIEKNQAATSKLIAETAAQTIQNQNAQKIFDQQYQKNNIEIGNQLAKLQESLLRANAYRDSLNNQQNNKSFNFTDLFRHNINNTTNNNDINWNEKINNVINSKPDNTTYKEEALKLHNDLAQKIEEQAQRLSKDKQERIFYQTKIEKEQKALELSQLNIEDKIKQREFIEKKNKLNLIELETKIERNRERDQAWREDRERELEQRKKEDNQNYKESYKENFLYRSGSAVANAHTGFGTSIMMSALTGGAINPAIIQALKLDKLLTAPLAAFGKSLLRSNKAGKTTSAIKNKKYSEITDRIDKANGTLDKLAAPKNKKEKKKNEKGIFEKIGDFFGSLGGIGTALGMGGIALLIKHLFPKTMKALGDKFSGFLEDKFGVSKGTADGLTQLISDAIPGAVAGYTFGGFKGMIIGAGLSMAGNYLKRKWDEWKGHADRENKPKSIGPIPYDYAEAMIMGATIGSIGGFKGMALGAVIGLAGQALWDLGNKIGEWIAHAVNNPLEALRELLGISVLGSGIKWAGEGVKALANKSEKPKTSGKAKPKIVKNKKTGKIELKKGVDKTAKNAGKVAKNATKATETAGKATKTASKVAQTAGKVAKTAGKVVKGVGKVLGPLGPLITIGESIEAAYDITTKGASAVTEYKKNWKWYDYLNPAKMAAVASDWAVDKAYKTKGPTYESGFDNLSPEELARMQAEVFGNTNDGIPDKEGNGYGSYNSSLLNYSGNTYKQRLVSNANRLGINPILLEDMSLKGSINNPWTAGGNSIPAINEKNRDNLTELDNKLSEWGYDVVYTSAMGGHILNSGHGRGNKVDLQLKKNGQPTHLTNSELYALRDAGYWGTGTGALGWEPVSGQVGGGHYDLFVGGQNSNINTPIKSLESNNFNEGINLAGGYSNDSGNNALDLFTGVYKGISSLQNNNFSLDTDNIPSSEMANTNALTQLNNAIGGTSNDSNNNSLSNLIADVASNTARNNQVSNQPIVYNNISNNSSNDDKVYPVGDLAKTLLYV